MIRFAWMQSRAQIMVAAGALAVIAVLLGITGPHLVHLYGASVATCAAHSDCPAVTATFLRTDAALRTWLGVLVIVIPGLTGIFWGAPLVARELEAGTFRLAWGQSITRTRWLAAKLAVIGLASIAAAGCLSLMVTWWASPLDRANMNLFGTFDQRGIVPIGYAAFAFALGVTAGVFIRRTLPAIAATLVTFVAARLAVTQWIRPHLLAPAHHDVAIGSASIVGYGSQVSGLFGGGPSTLQLAPPDLPGAWIYSAQLVDKSGQAMTAQFLRSACPDVVAGPGAGGGGGGAGGLRSHASGAAQNGLQGCAGKVVAKFHGVVTSQPASRYWAFQGYELAIFLGTALVLAGVCFWRVRRHRCEELHIRWPQVSRAGAETSAGYESHLPAVLSGGGGRGKPGP